MFSGWIDPSSANALWAIFYLLAGSAVTLIGYGIKTWPLVKARITEAKLADDQIEGSRWKRWQDEIARLDERVHVLETELAQCREEKHAAQNLAAVAIAEKARLEGFIAGRIEDCNKTGEGD